MEEINEENSEEEIKKKKPTITEWLMLFAVVLLIIFKFQYAIEENLGHKYPKNYWLHNYTEPAIQTNGPFPSDYLLQ